MVQKLGSDWNVAFQLTSDQGKRLNALPIVFAIIQKWVYMVRYLRNLINASSGFTAIEYALIAALMSVAAIAAIAAIA
jgi:hypothetical protein